MNYVEIIGWLGAALLLIGFVLNLFQKINADSITYITLNFVSSSLLLYNAYMMGVFPFVLVNGIWAAFSGYQLIRKGLGK